jgi:hypothetical protein
MLLTGSNDHFCKLMHQLNHMLQLIFYNRSKCVLKIRLTRENYSHDFFRKNSASPRAWNLVSRGKILLPHSDAFPSCSVTRSETINVKNIKTHKHPFALAPRAQHPPPFCTKHQSLSLRVLTRSVHLVAVFPDRFWLCSQLIPRPENRPRTTTTTWVTYVDQFDICRVQGGSSPLI